MNAWVGYLFLLVPIFAFAWIVRSYLQRSAEKEARDRERFANMVAITKAAVAAPRGPAPAASKPSSAAASPVVLPERFLSRPQTLLYYVLKAGLPGHEIFARISAAVVLSAPGSAQAVPELQRRLAQHDLDFVVCDKSMRVVAAIQLASAGRTGLEPDFLAQRLRAAGIKLVTLEPDALPRRDQVRSLIYG
jgi:hypothetical protein